MGGRLLATLVGVLALLTAATPVPARGSFAQLTARVVNPTNLASNLSLVGPTGLTATGTRFSVTLTWTAATPSSGYGNGYVISGVNNGASSACPATISSYTTWVGSTAAATTTFTDTGTLSTGTAGTYVCYLVQTGYSAAGPPPWASAPAWTNQGGLATVAFKLTAVANRQSGTEATGTFVVSPTLPAASTAGDLLVATVVSTDTTTPFTGPAGGWTRAARQTDATAGAVEVWYLANAGAGTTSATFTDFASGAMEAQLTEWSGVPASNVLDKTGTVDQSASSTTATVSTASATSYGGELAITAWIESRGTPSSGAGWTNLVADGTNRYLSSYLVQSAPGVASETAQSTRSSVWAGAAATFK